VRGPARLAQTAFNVVGDTFDTIKKKKWSRNPKSWFTGRGKNADYSRTKESLNNLRRDPKKKDGS
jgi:hypothetical protein